jgi:hypothetical protein
MKEVFSKTNFPKAPGGNLYHWEKADTLFQAPKDGKYLIVITASAKNGKKNSKKDDDDLRISLNDYDFGKYEIHAEKISWKGFGTASAWDGASLKGGEKTNYYFVELQKGKHTLKFYADNTPSIKSVKVFSLKEDEKFELEKLHPPQNIRSSKKGIPWIALIFLGVKPKKFSITSTVKSANQKGATDGDNLKVIVNGKIIQNKKAPTSRKYKNFYFSGDLNEGKSESLSINPKKFEFLEDSVELWYDEKPEGTLTVKLFDKLQNWKNIGLGKRVVLGAYKASLMSLAKILGASGYKYSKLFLEHSFKVNPQKLKFSNTSRLSKIVRQESSYANLLETIRLDIRKKRVKNGQIQLNDISFERGDLKFSLHGLKKAEYKIKGAGRDERIIIKLLDVYDFESDKYDLDPIQAIVNMADELEKAQAIKNFEIEIEIIEGLIQ